MIGFELLMAVFAAADLGWWWSADRRLRRLRRARPWRALLAAFAASQLAYVAGVAAGVEPHARPVGWAIVAYLWHVLILPAALTYEGFVRLWRAAHGAQPRPAAPVPSSATAPTRRDVIRAAAAVVVPPLIAAGTGVYAYRRLGEFRIRNADVPIPNLPADLDGLTIAHVTDLHIGLFLPRGTAERVADATNALEADLVVFAGDLMDHTVRDLRPGIDFLRRLHPRQGLAIVEGNHDVTLGARWFEDPLREAGLPLLLDESTTFRVPGRATPVQLLGITWGALRTGRAIGRFGASASRLFRDPSNEALAESVERVASLRQAEAFPILLAHHPHAFDPAAAAGLPLVLSGHTHGGQLMLTRNLGAGPLRFRYWSGLYRQGDARLFISNGIGNWFPLRVNAPPEIVRLRLRRTGRGAEPSASEEAIIAG